MNRSQKIAGLLAVLAGLIFLDSQLPITTVLKLAGDEGYDLMVGFLCSKGFVLYRDIWWDQTPLFPLCLSGVFRHFGPTLAGARLVAAAFGLLFFGSFYCLVIQRLNIGAALLATFFLVSSPMILLVSLSVIQEVPTFAVGLFSLCLLFRWIECRKPVWLWLSGCVMGLALGIKLTAGIMFPAIFMEFVLVQSGRKPGGLKGLLTTGSQWIGAVLLVFCVVSLAWGRGSFQIAYRSHLGDQPVAGMQRPEDFPFPTEMIMDHIECEAAAVLGIWLAVKGPLRRKLTCPVVLLATALIVHLIHRPYWTYYYVHLAVPLAWLAGYAVSEALTRFSSVFSKGFAPSLSKKAWVSIAAGLLAALVVVRSEKRLEIVIADIKGHEKVDANPIVAKMMSYGPKTKWVYAQEPIYPFAAHLLTPPELADVTVKRFWSRQLAPSDVVEIAKRYGVEQAVFNSEHIRDDWKEWLQLDFDAKVRDKDSTLYVLKTLSP